MPAAPMPATCGGRTPPPPSVSCSSSSRATEPLHSASHASLGVGMTRSARSHAARMRRLAYDVVATCVASSTASSGTHGCVSPSTAEGEESAKRIGACNASVSATCEAHGRSWPVGGTCPEAAAG